MGRAKKLLVVLLGAVFLCCTAAFAVGCARTEAIGGGHAYTAEPDSVNVPGAWRAGEGLTAQLDEALLEEQPLFTTDTLDTIKQYLTVTLEEDGVPRVLGADEYTLSGSINTAGVQTFTVIYVQDNSITTTVEITVTAVVPASIELTAAAHAPTLWSTAELSSVDSRYFTGSVIYNNGESNPIGSVDGFHIELVADPDDPDAAAPASLMPVNAEEGTAATYSRFVRVVIGEGTGAVSSNVVELQVTRDTIDAIEATLQVNVLDANTPITSENYGLQVTAFYKSSRYTSREIDLSDPYLEIIYCNGTQEDPDRQQLNFGDTQVNFVYNEPYTGEKYSATLRDFTVREAPIGAPTMDPAGNFIYDGDPHGKTFTVFNDAIMNFTTNVADDAVAAEELTLSATDAGDYWVTFTLEDGFYFQSPLPSGAEPHYAQNAAGENVIDSVTYRWSVSRASLTAANVSFTVDPYWTYADEANADRIARDAKVTANGQTIALDVEGVTVTYRYVGRNGTEYADTTAVPTQAGDYSAYVVIEGLANYADVTSNPVHFTIRKADNVIEFNGGAAWEWTYGAALPGDEGDLLGALVGKFDEEFAREDADYRENITLNYLTSGEQSAGAYPTRSIDWNAGSYILEVNYPGSANVNETTVRFNITVHRGTISFGGALAMSGWTFGEEAVVPAGVTVFVGDSSQKTQLDAQTAGSYRFSTAEGGSYADWKEFLAANDSVYDGSAALNAGTYFVRFEVTGTVNYAAVNGDAVSFTVLRRSIEKPVLAGEPSYTYSGAQQTIAVTGFDASVMRGTASAAETGDSVLFNNRDALTATAAGSYTLTVAMTSGNYAWTGESTDPAATPSTVELDWTIGKAQNVISAAETFAGWTYGDSPTLVSSLGATLAFTQDGQQIASTCYAADDRTAPVTVTATMPAGSYVLVLSVEDSDNTVGAEIERSFTVAVGSGSIEAELADTESWYYRDDLSEHALRISGTVNGSANLTFGEDECTVVYETLRGDVWEAVEFTDMAAAGEYRVTVSLTDSSDYTASSVRIAFTIQRFVVALPEIGRIHEFDGSVWTPSVDKEGERGAQWSVAFETPDSMAYGVYWLTLTLDDTANYVWGENFETGTDEDNQPITDALVEDGVVRMFYSITKTTYTATVNVRDYTYGETISAPTLTIDLAGSDLAEVQAAEQTISYLPAGSGDAWIEFEGQSLDAGEYRWRVFVAGTTNFSYAAFEGTFTVHPKALGEPSWENLTGTYGTSVAAEATFTGILGSDDLALRYRYIGRANDGTAWDSETAPVKAGTYTVTVTVGNSNYCISGTWGRAVMESIGQPYTVEQASVTLTVDDASIVYGDNAPAYTYTHTGGTLYYGDTLESILAGITFTYEDGYAAGSDSGEYTVRFTNAFDLPNYAVTAQSGTLTVDPFRLEVFFTNPTDLVYSGAQKAVTYTTNVPVGFAGTAPVLQLGYEMLAGGSYAACGTPVEVGTYRAVVTMTDTTGNYTFETAYGEAYTVAPAAIDVEELSTAGIWYTGNNYWLEEYLSVVTVNGQPYEAAFTVGEDAVGFLTDASEYVVEYTVTAPNHAAASGSFTLTIQKNVLVWAAEYGREDWTYGSSATAELAASAKFQNGTAAAGIIATAQVEYFTDAQCQLAYNGTFDNETAAGVYYAKVTVAGGGDNFDALTEVYSFTVRHAALTIEAVSANILYNAEIPDYEANITGFVNGESAESLGIDEGAEYELSCSYAKGSPVGTYAIVASGNEILGNYRVTYVNGMLTVGAQALTVVTGEMSDAYRTYGGAPIPYLVTAYGMVDGEEVELDIYYNGTLLADGPTDAGTYRVTFAPAVGENYTASNISFTFTILPREIAVDWTQTDTAFYYNGAVQSGGIAASYALWEGGIESDGTAALEVSLNGGGEFRAAGSYTFTAGFVGGTESAEYGFLSADGNYCIAAANAGRTQAYTIAQRPITVTVTPQTQEYGDGYAIPEGAVVVTTSVGDGSPAVIAGDTAYRLEVQTRAGAAVSGTPDVGTYYIRLASTDRNYDVELVSSEAAGGTVTYTVVPREVAILFTDDLTVVYGDALDESALRARIDFARVNGSETAFLDRDSAVKAAVVAALNFNHGGYTAQSDAGQTFTVTIGGMNAVPTAGNYTFVYADASTQLRVLQRAITLAIGSKTDLTYGTDEVWLAADSLSASVTEGKIVNNDSPYALGVYGADGQPIVSGWSRLPVGIYFIAGIATDANYAVTFTGDADYDGGSANAGTFAVVASEIFVSVNPSTDVWYTGGEYALLENGALTAFARETLLFEASVGTGETLSYTFTVSGQGDALCNAGQYTVAYTVSADNYSDKSGSFIVVIEKNEVRWEDPDTSDWGWTYGDAAAAQPVTADNAAFLYAPQFVHESAADGAIPTPSFAYFTDAACASPFTGTFDSRTDAGTYYVRVSVADTENYSGYAAVYAFEVAQKIVTVNWSMPSLQQSAAAGAQNYLTGDYDPSVMQVASGDFGEGDIRSDGSGYYVECADTLGTYIITFVLVDPDNYDWASHDAGSEDMRTIRFTVSTTVLTVTVQIDGWTYGDASVAGPTAVVAPLPSGFAQDSIVFTYAAGEAGLTDADMGSLGFAAVSDLTMLPAGSYWVRAYAPGAADGSYGMAFGYAHFTVSPRELAVPTQGGSHTFTYDGTGKTFLPEGFTATVELPNGQTVAAMAISGNTGVNAGDYTATVRLAGGNFVWQGGSVGALSFDWTIVPQRLAKPTIGTQGVSAYTSTYLPGAGQTLVQQFAQLFDFDAQLMSFQATAGASYANGQVAAGEAGSYTVTVAFKQISGGNYCWADGSAGAVTLTWTIDPALYDTGSFGFGEEVHTFVYDGSMQYPTLGNPPTGLRVVGYAGGAAEVADGVQTVTANIELVGPYATNFRFANGTTASVLTGQMQIEPAQVQDVLWSAQNDFTYTGADQSSLVHAYFVKADGSIGQLLVEVQNGPFVNAGDYTFAVTGLAAEDENYRLAGSFESGIYTIRKVDVTVVVEAPSAHVYDGKKPEPDTARVNEYGYYGFTVLAGGSPLAVADLPQELDRAEWLTYAPAVLGTGEWNVGSYAVTVEGNPLTNYTITFIEESAIAVTPAQIVGIEITVPNADGMVYGRLTEADAAYIDPDSDVQVVLGDGTETTVPYSEIADYVTLWYSGYAEGRFSTSVNAGTVWVFPLMAENDTCNYIFTDSSAFAKEYTVQKQTIGAELFAVTDVLYTGAAQTLPRENIEFVGEESWQSEFASYFADAAAVSLSAGSYADVGAYGATLTLSSFVYRNYCFEAGSSALTLAWEILPLQAEDITVTAPQVSVTDWGENRAAAVLIAVDSAASSDGGALQVAAFRYEYEMFDGTGWVSFVSEGAVWNAGSYRVRGVIADGNFPAAVSEWTEFVVEKGVYASGLLSWQDGTFLFDGAEHNLTLTVGGVPDADGVFTAGQLLAADGIGLTYTIGAGRTEVGSQEISVVITAQSPNYVFMVGGEAAAEYVLTATITIDARQTVVVWEGGNFVYDGTDLSDGVTAYFYDVYNQPVRLEVRPDRTFTDAGTYTFTVVSAPAGYVLVGTSEEFTIAPCEVSVVWPQDAYVYNGTDQFASVAAYFTDVNGEAVALQLRAFDFRNVNEGGYTFEVLGAADAAYNMGNYCLTGTTQVLHIAPLAVTVIADDKETVYGEEAELTWHATEAAFEADAADGYIVVTLTREAGDAMGSYAITATVGGALFNYTITTEEGVYTILAQAHHLQIRLPADRVYNGSPIVATLVGIDGAVPSDVHLYYRGVANDGTVWASANAPSKAGQYTVEARTSNSSLAIDCASVVLVIERAASVIDVSGVQTHYIYTGAQQKVNSGAVLNHGETQLVYVNNTFTTVDEGDGLRVRIYAVQTANYEAAEVFVTITVTQQSNELSVSIDDWTYGEEPNAYRLTGNAGGGRVTVLYTGFTNAGVQYTSAAAPTEAGEYTITVTVAATENYGGGSVSDTFTIHRAEADLSVSIEGWTYGQQPNGYVLTPALLEEYIENVYYTDGNVYLMQPPVEVGEYTLIVEVAESPNYVAGRAEATFAITLAQAELSVSIEGWTYGQAPNAPTVQAAAGSEVALRYTGTANDGTAWDSAEAPSKAGRYTVTATVTEGNFAGESAACDFTVARASVEAPSLGEAGEREASAVYDGETVTVVILGYDGARMQPIDAQARFELDEEGRMLLVADEEGVYTVTFVLTDADNYAWAAEEGEDFADGVVLTWTVTEKVDSLLWLIILLSILSLLLLILFVVLIILEKRAKRSSAGQAGGPAADAAGDAAQEEGAQDASDSALYALAPMGMLVVPAAHIAAVISLSVVAAVLLAVDIWLFVRWRKAVREAREQAAVEDAADYSENAEGTLQEDAAFAESEADGGEYSQSADSALQEDAAFAESEADNASSVVEPKDGHSAQ